MQAARSPAKTIYSKLAMMFRKRERANLSTGFQALSMGGGAL